VHNFARQHRRFLLIVAAAGLGLRLFFFSYLPAVTDDSHIYADIATNWLQQGTYAETEAGQVVPTDSRLPGYPSFLAAVFALFGSGNLRAVMLIQILVDLLTCLIISDLARRMISDRAARIAFLLAALCPFLAAYAAAVLTECLEIFFTALAFDLFVAALDRRPPLARAGFLWAGAGFSVAACILLRPDGGILLIAFGLFFTARLCRQLHSRGDVKTLLKAGVLLAVCSLAPLAPWAGRNFRQFHHFQPLAPRYAQEEDELVPRGFIRWLKTWIADYASLEELEWNVPGDKFDPAKLPSRAFDSPAQREATLAVIADYNQNFQMTRDLDARFAALAAERIHSHPVRYYFTLPLTRIMDMWIRPRTELTPADPRWWEFNDERRWSIAAVILGVINLAYVAAAILAIVFRRQNIKHLGLLLIFIVVRSAFLGTLENPEPRYTLECYPAVMVLAAAWGSKPHRVETRRAAPLS
jgi:4-amino-4-deoxy-L-arabinose transferase-like glycosyltransferase